MNKPATPFADSSRQQIKGPRVAALLLACAVSGAFGSIMGHGFMLPPTPKPMEPRFLGYDHPAIRAQIDIPHPGYEVFSYKGEDLVVNERFKESFQVPSEYGLRYDFDLHYEPEPTIFYIDSGFETPGRYLNLEVANEPIEGCFGGVEE